MTELSYLNILLDNFTKKIKNLKMDEIEFGISKI